MNKNRVVIPLKLITDAIEMASDDWNQYLDLENMEVVSLPGFSGEYDEDDEMLSNQIEEEWRTRFFDLPSQYDIHEYGIMEAFIEGLEAGKEQASLARAINGRGAFRRFKDQLFEFDMLDEWYAFKDKAYRVKAIEWCEEHGFDYSEEVSEEVSGETDKCTSEKTSSGLPGITSPRAIDWINRLGLEQHPEGGWFKECYQAPASYGKSDDGRVMGGTIYFLLANEDISHFHVIDCEEIWYYHEGCGVRIWCLTEEGNVSYQDLGCGEGCSPMVVIPKGVIFGASNLDPDSYTLMSCATMPNFHYEGFRLVGKDELEGRYPAELVEKYTI